MSAKALIPKSQFSARSMATAITNAMNGAAKAAKVDFKVTTATWKHQPDFTIENVTPYIRRIYTTDKVYLFVNFGTRAHIIRPKRAKHLRFSSGGRPKTVPSKIKSNKGSPGKVIVFAKAVNHPGTKARDFDQVIQRKWQDQLPILIQRAIDAEISR